MIHRGPGSSPTHFPPPFPPASCLYKGEGGGGEVESYELEKVWPSTFCATVRIPIGFAECMKNVFALFDPPTFFHSMDES
jgi:hypothetical protein